MLDRLLQTRLEPVVERDRQRRLATRLARVYGVAGLVGLVFLFLFTAWEWRAGWVAPVLLLGGFAVAVAVRWRFRRRTSDVREVAREIERDHPRLHALLLTAVEQRQDPATGGLGYLQERVVREAIEFDRQHPWAHRFYERLFFARVAQVAALMFFLVVAGGLLVLAPVGGGGSTALVVGTGIEVTPGDTTVERGEGLVVLARFGGPLPGAVVLVVVPATGEVMRLPLARNLDDPVYGGRIPEIRGDLAYRVEYDGEVTRDYAVTVYDLPRLERADAHLEYPAYTELGEKTIENTRRVSAVEGTRVRYVMELNKPVSSAVWVDRDQGVLALRSVESRSNAMELEFTLERNARYALRLTDAAGRTNRAPEQFVLEVFTNRTPELKLVLPRGDDRVSPLEEVRFRAQASDDFGLSAYGMGYRFGAGETSTIELGGASGRHEQREFDQVLPLETLSARPGQLLTYYFWADDVGPDGAVRRTFSDIYFLEVRPFDEIFRENQSGTGESPPGEQQPQGGASERLADLQKEIIAATWSLQRRGTPKAPAGFADDAAVIRQSQEHALEQAVDLGAQADDPDARRWAETARAEMERAVRELERAGAEGLAGPLAPALEAEQLAYEAVLQLQTREYQIARGQRGQGSGSRSGRMQRQLSQLQLKASEDRYETQRQATPQVDEQQREQLQFLARLKELAQRQQDVNARLRELELALQEARTDEEREEVRRQLRRLREQQEQMLSDVDELRQRMDRPGNQSETAEARRQLEETRSQLQRASEAMEQGAVSQAVASGTRASRQLEELREDFRTRNASQFTEAMREMRGQARDLVERQEELARRMAELSGSQRPRLSDAMPRDDLARQAAEQTSGLTNLLERVRRVTEESESAEPLLSRELYETFRQTAQADSAGLREVTEELLRQGALTRPVYDLLRFPEREGPGQSLATTERLLREGHLPAAQLLEEKARAGLGQLQRGIDRAAEKILGDDTEALRLARSELDELIEQLEGEITEGRGVAGETNAVGVVAGGRGNRADERSERGADDEAGSERGEVGTDRMAERYGVERSNQASSARPGAGEGGEGTGQAGGAGGERAGGDQPDGGEPRMFFENPGLARGGAGGGGGGPVTGTGYRDWLSRLGEVEELLDSPDLRSEVGRVRDRVRTARAEYNRHGEPPRWELVELEMAAPLSGVRDRLLQELARRQSPEALVPIDRDLVPPRYSELVRRYYENLGATD
ncbi:MAG: hypothetical protein KJ072_08410 [Verrucomicrobia bacterium]|nr:hypothetical protein [Verrucomicrobiota bacterium]